MIRCPSAYICSLAQLYPPYLAQILGFWVSHVELSHCLRHHLPHRLWLSTCIVALAVWALSIALALLPYHASIITLLVLRCHPCCAGVVALIVLRRHCSGRCLPRRLRHSSGAVALVPLTSSFVLAPSLSLHWHCHPHHAGLLPSSLWRCCYCCDVAVAIVMLALASLLLLLRPLRHHRAAVVCWHCPPNHAFSSCWCCRPSCQST